MNFVLDKDPCVMEDANGNPVELFTCKYCAFQTANIDVLDEHIIGHDEAILEDNFTEEKYKSLLDSVVQTGEQTNSCIIPANPKRCKRKGKQSSKKAANYSKISFLQSIEAYQKEVEYGAKITVSVCPYCGYQNINTLEMDRHLNEHCEPVEVAVYACFECSYTTIRKSDMSKHLLTHVKDGSGATYECTQCAYTTIKKWCLQKHLLCHKQPEEVQMHSCPRCAYSTKRRSDLKKHLLTHETHPNFPGEGDSDNIAIYRCTHCPYETIKKWCLQKHMFRHKKPEEVEMFLCHLCTYSTNRRNSLKKHELTHKKHSKLP